MIITDYTIHSQDELFDIIRHTTLLGDHNIYPFENSKLSIKTISHHDVLPTQAFVLQEQLTKIDDIHTNMQKHNIDVLKMNGFLSYKVNLFNTQFVFTPPIIEVIEDQPLIIDGQHRITYAADKNLTFNALFIENVDKSVYPYQIPLRNGWNNIQRFDTHLPDGFIRKERRYPNGTHKFYFREYPFPGVIKLIREHTGR